MDMAFEVAFEKASVLIAKYRENRFQGEMPDLVAALEEAREVGHRPTQLTESQQAGARVTGMDVDAERQEKIAMMEGLLSEIRNRH